MEDDYAIGLDLGTTFSCIGVYRNGGVEIIPNSIGEKTTPSIVIFKDNEILVGEDTTDVLVKYYDNCLYEVKRLIGLDFSKKEYKKEIVKLPFKVNLPTNENEQANIEVIVNNEKKEFSPTEISSLIIKKMVHNAENYLNKKINKLVITVPANFSENQKKLTSQAVEMLNLEVIKMINEPTAAALAYGFTEVHNKNKKILVFDLGGGTFDVSILSFENENDKKEKINNKKLSVLATAGDMHLGGEDFDNALLDYVIQKSNVDEKKIRQNNQAIKRLKLACEHAKKILSLSDSTTLRIYNILEKTDIIVNIDKEKFERICQPLFDKLELPLITAISEAEKKMKSLNKKFSKDDIDEIILVGGSTRIPKIKEFVKNFFPNKKINDSINPDEAVAFGATLQAEKILYNRDKIISNFHILDIVPFSFGIKIKNISKDKELQNEGSEMSVIIKRGTPLPTFNNKIYATTNDNQTTVIIEVYEGEKKYVKYNHLLTKARIIGLSPKPKGETKILIEFKIDINGILYIKAVELSEKNGKSIELAIKNDNISFSREEMEQMKEKMEELTKNLKYKELTKEIDYSNLKDILKIYKNAYDKCGDDEEENKIIYLNNFNEALEDFIDRFGQDFDNETLLEKFYLYIKELFLSYLLTLKFDLDKSEKKFIFDKIEKYLKIFIDKSSGYLDNLIEILSELQKNKNNKIYFNNLIIFIMDKLNKCGINYINSNKEFSKYNALMYFEQSYKYYIKYFSNENEASFDEKTLGLLKEQKEIFTFYISDINSGNIILIEEVLRQGNVFEFTKENKYRDYSPNITVRMGPLINLFKKIDKQRDLYILSNELEKILSNIYINNELYEKEVVCITNIIIINDLLGSLHKKYLFVLFERCNSIIDKINIDRNKPWFQEFLKYKEKLDKKRIIDDYPKELIKKVKKENSKLFDEIDEQFEKNDNKIKFIDFILSKYPYNSYEKNKNEKNFKVYNKDLLFFLIKKYEPQCYLKGHKLSEMTFCINAEILSKLSNLFITI